MVYLGHVFIFTMLVRSKVWEKILKNINLLHLFQFVSILKRHCVNIMICNSNIVYAHKPVTAFVISSKAIFTLLKFVDLEASSISE